jgi:urease accessory protein
VEDLEFFNLLHLADSALPVGSFAFSLGLESLAKHGQLQCVQDLAEHLSCGISQCCAFDIPILYSMFSATEFEAALHHYHYCTRLPSLRRAAETQGRAWLRLIRRTHPWLPCDEIEQKILNCGRPTYFLAVFALVMQAMKHSQTRALRLYLYCGIRDQVSVAIRLGLVGPGLGHALLSRQIQTIPTILNTAGQHYREAVRTLPVLDLAQLGHSQLYSKQYQN